MEGLYANALFTFLHHYTSFFYPSFIHYSCLAYHLHFFLITFCPFINLSSIIPVYNIYIYVSSLPYFPLLSIMPSLFPFTISTSFFVYFSLMMTVMKKQQYQRLKLIIVVNVHVNADCHLNNNGS